MRDVVQAMSEIRCGECDIVFGVPAVWLRERQQDGRTFACPNGHKRVFRDTELDQLRRERDRLKQARAWDAERIGNLETARDHAQRSANAYKGHLGRVRRRVGAGVCPCCNRSFANLQRHMAGQHPAWAPDEEAQAHG